MNTTPTVDLNEAAPPPVITEAAAPNLPTPELRGYEVCKRLKGGDIVRVHTLKPTMVGFMQAKADVTYLNRRAFERKTGEMYFLSEVVSAIWVPPAPSEPLVLEADEHMEVANQVMDEHAESLQALADDRVENGAYDVVDGDNGAR